MVAYEVYIDIQELSDKKQLMCYVSSNLSSVGYWA